MKTPTSKKHKRLNKSLKYYIICGIAVAGLLIGLLLIYALIEHINILEWFGSKFAFLLYGAIFIYIVVGIILFIRGKIERL